LGVILRVNKYQEKCGFAIEFSGLAFLPFFKTIRESAVLTLGRGAARSPRPIQAFTLNAKSEEIKKGRIFGPGRLGSTEDGGVKWIASE
jgi:hypothetical protein